MMPARKLPPPGGPRVIVFGNEKGGTGKSTLAMHTAVALMHRGLRVGTVDLDARQGTLTRYVTNRAKYADRTGAALPQPTHRSIHVNPVQNADEAELTKALDQMND